MSENNPEPSYYAILEADVRYDNDLKPNEKLLYAEITALANQNGYCWAMNSYFAELFDVTKQTVSSWISNLVNKDYLDREIVRDKSKRIKERRLTPINKKINTPKEKNREGIKKKVKENNTRVNSTSNNKHTCDFESISKAWQSIIGQTITKNKLEFLQSYLDDLSQSLIEEALQRTADNTDRYHFNYCKSILNNWVNKNVESMGDVEQLDKEHEEKKSGYSPKEKKHSKPKHDISFL